jgi:hypothetical protein
MWGADPSTGFHYWDNYWKTEGSELEPQQGQEFSPNHPDQLWGPTNLSNGYWGLFPQGVKQQGCEADHSLPASAEVKKMWIYKSTPHYAFMA